VNPTRSRFSLGNWLLPVYSALALVFLLVPIVYTFVFLQRLRQVQHHLERIYARQLAERLRRAGGLRRVRHERCGWGVVDADRHSAGNVYGNRSGAVPVSWPVGSELAAVPSDGNSRGCARGGACRTISQCRGAEGTAHHSSCPCPVLSSGAQVFWRITFPLLLPGITAAALLSFALSFDDFIITRFNNGPVETFPVYVYTAAARGLPAEANVIASAVFLLAIILVVTGQLTRAARARRLAARS
jgi:spermidine/putrescine transport system permease protein